MAKLAENYYGKSRVRLLKVKRDGNQHTVYEWTVGVYLEGDFGACFVDGDNSGLLATDTMKNTVYSLARTSAALTMEEFAVELAGFLAGRNPLVSGVRVTVEEKMWIRIKADGERHPFAFLQRGPDLATTSVTLAREGRTMVTSGVKGLVILKTSQSGFGGFKRDELTTLKDTSDRLLGSEATIDWVYSEVPRAPSEVRTLVMDTLLSTFAKHDSLSVQQTLYAMAEAVLAAEKTVQEITLTMPNRHNIAVDLSQFEAPFRADNPNMIFVPTDEPHGLIHARVTR